MAVELPEHLIFLILLWLPVKSLLRFKSVCKCWYALIQSSTFINQHLYHQHHYVNCSLIVKKESGEWSLQNPRFFMLNGDQFDQSPICLDFANTPEMTRYNINVPFLIEQLSLGYSCNGIICLYFSYYSSFGNEDVALWNPATRQLRPLPLSQFPISCPPRSKIECFPLLGFDNTTNDYKVARFTYLRDDYVYKPFEEGKLELYSLSTDAWRIIHRNFNLCFFQRCQPVYKNGVSFFCGWNPRPEESEWSWFWILISFDFSTETFRFMPMPNVSESVRTLALDFLDDSLICFTDPNELIPVRSYNSEFDIWMLHGYGIKESWTKLYTIGPFDWVFPRRFLKERKFLLLMKYSRLCLYNQVTEEMQDLCSNYFDEHYVYNESLVSIKGENDAANRETSLLHFARNCLFSGDEGEEEDDKNDMDHIESQSEEESEEDVEIQYLEKQVSDELDLRLNI